MPLVAPDWLDGDVVACLEQKCGTFDKAFLLAYKRDGVGDDELLDLWGVRLISVSVVGVQVLVPVGLWPHEREAWERVAEYHGCVAPKEDERVEGLQHRDPLPTLATTEAVRLRIVEEKSWPQIESALELSHRKVNYINLALKHDDLGWDLDRGCITLGPETRNTPEGLVLPRR